MRVIALMKFNDEKEGTIRNEGDVFTVSTERYEQIMAYRTDLIDVFEQEPPADQEKAEDPEKPEEPKEEAEKPAAKKTQRKNASK